MWTTSPERSNNVKQRGRLKGNKPKKYMGENCKQEPKQKRAKRE